MGSKKTKDKFIDESKMVHGDKYDYSEVEYVNNKTKVKIICHIHGVFEQTPDKHINSKNGCKKCKNWAKTNVFNHKNTIINRFIEKHGDKYDYSLVNYINNSTKVKIICQIHGEFEQMPNNHLSGNGCPNCGGTKKYVNNEFIDKCKKVHGDKYVYSKVNYVNNRTKVDILCPVHGIFKQTFNKHYKRKNGCPICKESKGEKFIRVFLENNDIEFIPQYRFSDCVNTHTLPFDFYLPKYNTCIEFHGEQHYKPILIFGGEEKLKQQQINDKIKYDYCIKNDIKYICIKYNDDIKKSMNKFLKYE